MNNDETRQIILERLSNRLLYIVDLFRLINTEDNTEKQNTYLFSLFYLVCIIEGLLGILISDKVGGVGAKIRVGNRYTHAQKIGLTEGGDDLFLCIRVNEEKKIEQVDLRTLIEIAHRERIVTKRDKNVLHRMRNIRNGVHLMNVHAISATRRDIETAMRITERFLDRINAGVR